MNQIKIKCPTCGARLTVIDSPENKGKSVRCPICKEKRPFSQFRIVSTAVVDDNDKTQIGVGGSAGDMTELPGRKDQVESGYLKDNNMHEYPLNHLLLLISP